MEMMVVRVVVDCDLRRGLRLDLNAPREGTLLLLVVVLVVAPVARRGQGQHPGAGLGRSASVFGLRGGGSPHGSRAGRVVVSEQLLPPLLFALPLLLLVFLPLLLPLLLLLVLVAAFVGLAALAMRPRGGQ